MNERTYSEKKKANGKRKTETEEKETEKHNFGNDSHLLYHFMTLARTFSEADFLTHQTGHDLL